MQRRINQWDYSCFLVTQNIPVDRVAIADDNLDEPFSLDTVVRGEGRGTKKWLVRKLCFLTSHN